jgi:regulatory protein
MARTGCVPLSARSCWMAVKPKPEQTLKGRAMRYLARREHSRAELQAKLLPHVQEADNLDAVLDDLVRRGWLSDERAAEQMVSQRRSRFGAQRIAHELRRRGIGESLICAAMPQLKQSEHDAAREVWQKKFGTLPQDAKEKARQVRFLQSRGFSMESIFDLFKSGRAPEDD